jgi:hypothetical protein
VELLFQARIALAGNYQTLYLNWMVEGAGSARDSAAIPTSSSADRFSLPPRFAADAAWRRHLDPVERRSQDERMAIGRASLAKTIAQSSLEVASSLFANQATETALLAAGAYLSVLRGSGWSPSVKQEARCAAKFLTPGREFVLIDAGATLAARSSPSAS